MTELSIIDYIFILSGFCSVISLILVIIFLKKGDRRISLFITAVLIGFPSIIHFALYSNHNKFVSLAFITLSILSIIYFSFTLGKYLNSSNVDTIDLKRFSKNRPNTFDWITEKLQTNDEIIEIDAFGVKCSALYKIIKGIGPSSKLPNKNRISIRLLILGRGTYGVQSRVDIEEHEKVIKDVEMYNEIWPKIRDEVNLKTNINLDLKLFKFTPSFYIVRINNSMLIGTYLAETGYENVTFELYNYHDGAFDQFKRYFNQVWENVSVEI